MCNFLGSVSPQQKFEVTDGITAQCYSSVAAQFYLVSKGKYILEALSAGQSKRYREEKPEAQF